MVVRVVRVRYVHPENDSWIRTGVPRNDYPRECLSFGANGTYRIVYSTSADIGVIVCIEGKTKELRMGNEVREACGWNRLTKKRAEMIADVKPSHIEVEKTAENVLKISKKSLKDWLGQII